MTEQPRIPVERYEPAVDDFGNQYLARRDTDTCHNCGQKMVSVGIGPFALETAECAKCGHGRGHHDGQRCWVYLEQKPHRCRCDGKFKESLP